MHAWGWGWLCTSCIGSAMAAIHAYYSILHMGLLNSTITKSFRFYFYMLQHDMLGLACATPAGSCTGMASLLLMSHA